MPKAERRLIALFVGIGATGVGCLSKETALLSLPGWLLAVPLEKFFPMASWLIGCALNFLLWSVGTYMFLTLKVGRRPAA
jgi:hypothetical protein